MSPELREEIALELAQLWRALDQFGPLIDQARVRAPNRVETLAAAGLLHSLYTGIENLFKRVAIHLDGGPPRGEAWHSQLLESMARPGPNRPSVISVSLRDRLRTYLDFRHVFRQAYSFELQWSKMAPLVFHCRQTLEEVAGELDRFLAVVRPENGTS